MELTYKFVEYIPEELKERKLYVSTKFGTALHKCCCGCGSEVVTPLSPTDWKLTFDGVSVSLYPSIGSWNLPCRSHYLITNNEVVWAATWTEKQIARGRASEALAKERYFAGVSRTPVRESGVGKRESGSMMANSRESFWGRIMRWLFHWKES